MPLVRISDATRDKLKSLSVPLDDNINSVVNRLCDFAVAGVPYKKPETFDPNGRREIEPMTESEQVEYHALKAEQVDRNALIALKARKLVESVYESIEPAFSELSGLFGIPNGWEGDKGPDGRTFDVSQFGVII